MAQFYTHENLNTSEAEKYRKKKNMWYILAFICFALANLTRGLTGIPFFIFMLLGVSTDRKYRMLKSGVDGEQQTQRIVSHLPDNYVAISNVKVEANGKSELDLVVVGDNGVFVIETKNHNGTIVGNTADERWTQHKVGRKGGEYSKDMYSPVKQVGTHVFRLSKFLKLNGINVWVQGIVYFSNYQAVVEVNQNLNNAPPVFAASEDGVRELVHYISYYNGKNKVDKTTFEKIVNLLK